MRINILLTVILIFNVSFLLLHWKSGAVVSASSPTAPMQAGQCQQFDPDRTEDCGSLDCGKNISANQGYTNGPGTQSLMLTTTTCGIGKGSNC